VSGRKAIWIVSVAGAVCFAFAAAPGRTAPPPRPPNSSFTARVDNPWFPLRPGSRWIYQGVDEGRPSREVVIVARRTTLIDGVPCVAVEDRLYIKGRVRERTTDWYTQDRQGNVWYFGENTATLDAAGKVTSKEGSWRAGISGAQPGMFMPANPRVGQTGQQEFYKGHAEDQFRVIGLFHTVVGASGPNALLIRETSPLEPGVVDHKFYVRGIGTALEQSEQGGNERNELVSFKHS
jgi:hypothetical protein